MSDYSFEYTGIWRGAFQSEQAEHVTAQDKVRTAYRSFWDNAVMLAGQISSDMPQLTLHNEAHFASLWQRADLIVGEDWTLNPLELFVLGGAILLHDLGHAIATFPGGLDEIKKTPQWRDAVIAAYTLNKISTPTPDFDNPPSGVLEASLFGTLRVLHASRAEQLASINLQHDDKNDPVPLIEDTTLRLHLGEVIGLIAASHHWDLQKVARDLTDVMGPPPAFPSSWRINPLKIACLIRCADAIQIDQSRAPDFLYALLQLQGVSEKHWRAQNRLMTPVVDASDPRSIVFSSSKSFEEKDAEAWWIAFDAIQVANRELNAVDRLLRDLQIKTFRITGVKGAQSEERLARHIKTKGWRPVRTKPFVSAADRIIGMFGGEQLYGHDKSVALRELIQNAADAVRAKRADAGDARYRGSIDIIAADATDGQHWLFVDDDGIGMTEKTLAGPLLEFGKSYWTSDQIREEWPGLASKLRGQTGRYGIGFYSVFMLSRVVKVCSRPYNSSVSDFRTLYFNDGYEQRPILLDNAVEGIPSGTSTRIALLVNSNDYENLLQIANPRSFEGQQHINLAQLVAHLCPCLDVDIFVTDKEEKRKLVHRQNWSEEGTLDWLRDVTLSHQADAAFDEYLRKAEPRLRKIEDGTGRIVGFAALGDQAIEAGIHSIGGLIDGRCARAPNGFSMLWVGAFERTSEGPRRFGDHMTANAETITQWANAASTDLLKSNPPLANRYLAALFKSAFDADPTDLATISVNGKLVDIQEIVQNICEDLEKYVIPIDNRRGSYNFIGGISFQVRPGYYLGLHISEVELDQKTIIGIRPHSLVEPKYLLVSKGRTEAENSFLWCLQREINKFGFRMNKSFEDKYNYAKYVGESSLREGLETNTLITGPCVIITATKL